MRFDLTKENFFFNYNIFQRFDKNGKIKGLNDPMDPNDPNHSNFVSVNLFTLNFLICYIFFFIVGVEMNFNKHLFSMALRKCALFEKKKY